MPKETANIFVRGLYSIGFSSLIISFFKGDLIFKLAPYVGKDARGYSQYSKETFISTSINYGGASYFFLTVMSILYGEETARPVAATYQCNNGAVITLEYSPYENNRMWAYLVISKNNVTIPFRFNAHQYQVMENGRMVSKTSQAGLGVFAAVLEGYLRSTGINAHLSNLPEYVLDDSLEPPTTGNGGWY